MPNFSVSPARPEDLSEIGALVARVKTASAPERYPVIVRRAGTGLLTKPGFRSSMSRIGVLDDTVVAQALVEPYTLCYGSIRLRVAGIGNVCTHPDHRGAGYTSAVLRDALAYIVEQGAHLALLEGASHYYERFGFSPVFPYYYFEVDSAEAAALPSPLVVRDARPEDAPAMARLYDRHWGWRVTLTRSPELWLWRMQSPDRLVQVIEAKNGKLCGYVAGHDLSGDPVEAVVDTQEAATTLLSACGRAYQQAGVARMRWHLPPDDALVNYARTLLTVTVSARYQPSGGWMARLIDSTGLIETLLPEILAQAQSTLPDLTVEALAIHCQPETVQINWRKNISCQLNHQDFIQIMFGSLRPAALAARTPLHPAAVMLLEALFPPRVAALAGWDWF
jgi:predicted N-acetyltransferase YhbS